MSEVSSTAAVIALVLLGCCSNVVFLELLVKEDPGSGNVITFSQFLFITITGFIFTMDFGRKTPTAPMKAYVTLVVMYFMVSVTNNMALNFNISMPLHMIFRAGSLMANMVMGYVILKKRYTVTKYAAVFMISVGIAACTIASGKDVGAKDGEIPRTESEAWVDFLWWLVGISLLTFALFLSARMGIYQEVLYKDHGNNAQEALFFTHALPMPGFLLLTSDLIHHFGVINASPVVEVPLVDFPVPRMWLYLLGNLLTQYLCISSVFKLTTTCSSLTVTLVVTLRKFISLVFSILYFRNPFTWIHWLGTVLVFAGTGLFSDIPALIRSARSTKAVAPPVARPDKHIRQN